ncbi:MAG: tandem-95 repeat protein [Opitutae bacterium]|nr:tandem-95 repeat protein [Opitutae bacterium]
MIDYWIKLVTLCVAGTFLVPQSGSANKAPVAVDDAYMTLQGQKIEIGSNILESSFDSDTEGFSLVKDSMGTQNAQYIQGSWKANAGRVGGGLQIKTGPTQRQGTGIGESSGTFEKPFVLNERTEVSVKVRYRMTMASGYESIEFAAAVFGINMKLLGNNGSNTLINQYGDGNGGTAFNSGWREETFTEELDAGWHTIWAGIYSNNSSALDEYAEVFFDDIEVQPNGKVGVLLNDKDADGDRLYFMIGKKPENGLLVSKNNGSFTYTPNPGFAGIDEFKYRAFDGSKQSRLATVRITVDGIPIPQPDQYTLDEDSSLETTESNSVLKNDLDPEETPLTATLINPPTKGQFEFFPNGTFKYIPNPNYGGLDSFTYLASDGQQTTEPVTVELLIRPIDDPAISTPDKYNMAINQILSVGIAQGLLANDSDPDGPALNTILATPPENGQLEFHENGAFKYTPSPDFTGTDIFTYRLAGSPASEPTTRVTINISKPKARIVINEIMYNTLGDKPQEEFIELQNTGSLEADLSGWRFSKGVSYTFPDNTRLGIGEYLVVTSDRLTFRTRYPTFDGKLLGNWIGQLSNSGEKLQLEDANGKNMDEVPYHDEGDWAVRRVGPPHNGFTGFIWEALHDGQGRSLELGNPEASNKNGQNWFASKFNGGTPGFINSQATSDVAPFILKVRHSPALPTSNDHVAISAEIKDDSGAPPSNAQLYWRVDGASFFNQSIMLDNGASDDGKAGDQTYGAILPPHPNGTIVEFYVKATDGHNVRTWPGPTNDSGVQEANCHFQVFDSQGTENNTPVYRVITTSKERSGHLAANRKSDSMVNSTFVTSFDGKTEVCYRVGMRYRGSGSRGSNPPPYRINLSRDDPWEDLTRININPVNWYSQLAGSAIFNQLGLPAARATAIDFFINGQHQQSNGHYVQLQPLSTEFVESTFPRDSNGNLYKGRRKGSESPQGGLGSGLVYHPGNTTAYSSYIKLTNSTTENWSDVIALTKALSEISNQTNFFDPNSPPPIHSHLDLDQWLKYFALHALLSNNEGGLVEGDRQGDDYAMYSGVKDPRFRMISHDLDSLFSSNTWNLFKCTNVPALGRLINHPQIRPRYLAFIKDWAEGFFETNKFRSFLENQLLPEVPQSRINNMVNFMGTRTNYVLSNTNWFPENYTPPPLKTLINGVPTAKTPLRSASLQVAGGDVTHYRYRLNKTGQYSSTIYPVEEPIVLNNLPYGEYSIYVRGINQNSEGGWQYDLHETQSDSWTIKPDYFPVRINEVLANNTGALEHEGTLPDYVEIFNAGTTPILLEGLAITDNINQKDKFVFPGGIILPAGEYKVLYADSNQSASGIHLGFALDAEGDELYLLDSTQADATILDQVTFGLQIADMSIGRDPELHWALGVPTPEAGNQRVPMQSPWNLKINEWLADGARIFNDDFIEIYNPSPLPVKIGGFHLTDNPIGDPALHRITPNSYIPAQGHITFLAIGKTSKDARHLNFQLSAQREMISLRTADLETIDTVTFGPQQTDVSEGRTTDGATTFTYFPLPTPGRSNSTSDPNEAALLGQLRITEIMYNPLGGSIQEYIELKNTGNMTVDLSRVKFTNGISYTFGIGVLQAGATIVLANDIDAFQERYGEAPDGQFSGNLSNSGEKIRLETATGIGILEFNYDDDWHKASDGDGFSLEITDENAYPENWGLPSSWRTGRVMNGSPGGPEPSNSAPTDILLTPGTLNRNLEVGGIIGILIAVDTYPRDNFTFVMTNPGNERFSIEQNQLVLKKATEVSEKGPFTVSVRVTDSYGENFSKTLHIQITDPTRDDDSDDLPDEWETTHFGDLSQTGSGDYDGDGQENHIEYLAGTDPKDPNKSFTLGQPKFQDGQFLFTFEGLQGKIYRLESTVKPSESWQSETSTSIREGIHQYNLPINGSTQRLYRIVIEE